MRGLTVIVTRADAEALRTALTLTAASAALGGRAQVYLHEDAVSLLGTSLATSQDAQRKAAGLPDLPATLVTAQDVGVAVIACQTGLALAGIDAAALPPGVTAGGLVGLLAGLGHNRLVTL